MTPVFSKLHIWDHTFHRFQSKHKKTCGIVIRSTRPKQISTTKMPTTDVNTNNFRMLAHTQSYTLNSTTNYWCYACPQTLAPTDFCFVPWRYIYIYAWPPPTDPPPPGEGSGAPPPPALWRGGVVGWWGDGVGWGGANDGYHTFGGGGDSGERRAATHIYIYIYIYISLFIYIYIYTHVFSGFSYVFSSFVKFGSLTWASYKHIETCDNTVNLLGTSGILRGSAWPTLSTSLLHLLQIKELQGVIAPCMYIHIYYLMYIYIYIYIYIPCFVI